VLCGIKRLDHHVDRICSEANVHRFSKSLAAISKFYVRIATRRQGATVQNLFITAFWHQEFVHP